MSLLEVHDVKVQFKRPAAWPWQPAKILQAVDGVSFDLEPGQTLGVVGESGCGKSTLARAILGLTPAVGGSVKFEGQEILGRSRKQLRPLREDMQVIFQDPLASLNPRMTIGDVIAEPLQTHGKLSRPERLTKVKAVMDQVGLSSRMINRYPHEFSGGQCQRIGIARALVLQPKLLVCDEPVSALDVSIQAQIVNLLEDLQKEFGLALMFIAHDLSVVRHISDEVLVMYLGRMAELAEAQSLYKNPQHPYTQALIRSVPEPDPAAERTKRIAPLTGDLPSPVDPPSGCAFHNRCPLRAAKQAAGENVERCEAERPQLRALDGHQTACHFV